MNGLIVGVLLGPVSNRANIRLSLNLTNYMWNHGKGLEIYRALYCHGDTSFITIQQSSPAPAGCWQKSTHFHGVGGSAGFDSNKLTI